MAMKVTLIENLDASMVTEPLSVEQLMVAALFGGDLKTPSYYDTATTYNKNDKIMYKDPTTGKISILYCKQAATTGSFDISKWSQYSLFDGAGTSSGSSASSTVVTRNLDNNIVARLLNI